MPRPPVLVPATDGYGTLAAIRDLGRSGLTVLVPKGPWHSPGRYSRYVTRRLSPLREGTSASLLGWLEAAGKEHGGAVLMPPSDTKSWWIARSREELSDCFALYCPSADSLYAVLNKVQLAAAAGACGVATPQTWIPAGTEEVSSLAPMLKYPVVIKPRTHVGKRHWLKAKFVADERQLRRSFPAVTAKLAYSQEVQRADPRVGTPIIQQLYPAASSNIYTLFGFIDESGDLVGFDASRKLVQYPHRFGDGACFRSEPVDDELSRRLAEMCRGVGFFGMFEAEFIEEDGRKLLIDFNPRLFNGLALPVARGLRLPYLHYLAVVDRLDESEPALGVVPKQVVDRTGSRPVAV